jgi:hypothetical protein
MTFIRTLGCPGCPGCVLAAPPVSRDTLNLRVRPAVCPNHSNFSEVSWVSWVISFPSRDVRVRARLTRLSGSRKQAGHPGHLKILTMKPPATAANSRKQGVLPERGASQDTPGQPGHLSGLTRGVRA